jgi:uncharacterized Rmd1/YagE family protein
MNRRLLETKNLHAQAWYLGTRLDLRHLEKENIVSPDPLTIQVGKSGHAVLFRYGVVVLINLLHDEATAFLEALIPLVGGGFDEPASESIIMTIDPDRIERVETDGVLVLHEASLERLQGLAHILAKSTVLAHHEERIASVFDRLEKLAESLRRGVWRPASGQELLRYIGDVLLVQTSTVGRVEVTEKPELTWDNPELDRLYERLCMEYELHERDLALARKLDLISHTAQTYLDLLQNRQSLRVEWYIVILIVVEIALLIYDLVLTR